jgi:S1-C subfamily serine protease
MARRLFGLALAFALLATSPPLHPAAAQLDPALRDRVVPAAVELALIADVTDNGQVEHDYLPVGSGTIVSPDGLVLTNWHVVDLDANHDHIAQFEAQQRAAGHTLAIDLDPNRVLLLTTNGVDEPQPAYLATVTKHDADLDLAVLTIVADDQQRAIGPSPALPFVPLGDSDALRLGEALHVFGYPGIGGEALTYTPGVVTSLEHADGIAGVAWVTTDAVLSAGSSGGAALNAAGDLVGVPTQGSALDCRPGDTNGDGTASAADAGCVPYGGSLGEVRPINLAKPLLAQAGFVDPIAESTTSPTATDDAAARMGVFRAPDPDYVASLAEFFDHPKADAAQVQAAMDAYCATGPLYPPGVSAVVATPWPFAAPTAEDDWRATRYYAWQTGKVTQITDANGVVHSHAEIVAMPQAERDALADQWLVAEGTSVDFLPPRLVSAPDAAARPLGILHAGVTLTITGPYIEGGSCDWWPVQVVDPHGAATLQAGQTGYVLEQYLRPAAGG